MKGNQMESVLYFVPHSFPHQQFPETDPSPFRWKGHKGFPTHLLFFLLSLSQGPVHSLSLEGNEQETADFICTGKPFLNRLFLN